MDQQVSKSAIKVSLRSLPDAENMVLIEDDHTNKYLVIHLHEAEYLQKALKELLQSNHPLVHL
jgi:hypothetical protein